MNNYMFIRVVGKGSYGEVNLVKHKTDRKQYVIKKLNLTTSSKRERRAAEQEAQLLSQLRHPNIVTYRESWEGEDCQLYIVMGFCEGGDLYHRLKQQKGELLPERQVVEWFVQIAMALQYLHEKRILHRDLKTQNIFLTKTNIIKVGDLGIARVLENQNDMASTLIGTPYYMSPELFSNKPYNHKSDVWALGCCVYEMSTLKHAFNAKDMNSLVYRIVEGKLPQMPCKYDPQLGALIKSMLCKRPEDRPDVKLILRQPYIKQQIAMFLEATKEKTAKSRKKVVGGSSRPNSAASVVLSQPRPERPTQCPQPDPNTRGKRKEEINTQDHKGRNGITEDTPPQTHLTPKSPTPDILNTTGASLATISNIDIDLQTQEEETNAQRGDPPQTVSNARADNDALCERPMEERKGGKQDPSPPLPPRRLLSGVSTREEERKTANGPVMQGAPKPRDRVRTSVEKTVNTDDKDDTMELLKDVVIESPATERSICLGVSTSLPELRSAGQLKVESTGQTFVVNIENKDDTRNLLKEVPAHKHTAVVRESLESTEKLLEPLPPVAPCHVEPLPPVPEQDTPPLCTPSSETSVSHQHRQRDRVRIQSDQDKCNKVAGPRPLPPPPVNALVVEVKKRSRTNTEKRATITTSSTTVSSFKDSNTPLPQERLLSARERRRLRQSQQNPSQPVVNAVRRASYDVASLHNKQPEFQNSTVTCSVSDMGKETNKQDRFLGRLSDEDECSSSTSSTDHSEGDCKEGKSESSDMQDLVQMMTQTLRMDGKDTVSELDGVRSTPLTEFKLNRKYRDTLVLHGKAREEQEFHFSELSTGTTSGPAKIRRAIEHLKTDVVKGLGVKLLNRVLDIMEDDDEDKRELCLRKQMGEDKYQSYALMDNKGEQQMTARCHYGEMQ
ncbi:serine/threonine-protein kinase Nek4 isoform X2 [Coregonus clupeaformis]|uniref:serine/threonine-protein kinase Nek4 isoform X2 n=1 Tax=Coregonus clupeaformis TaxID=59861 RepID=UPI001E1C3252|nr:serine/threonine-protein kinase Nek4 isoform X2 [Coregonus clupeaformis]